MLWIWAALGVLFAVVLFRGIKVFSKPNLVELLEVARQCRVDSRFVEAAVLVRKARAAYPDSADASREHVTLLFASKRYADAERLKGEHLKRWPDDSLVRDLSAG
ncbi:MAG: tetratricopeptide repeat protein [Myxococcota bacterium]|nr:tetratricopeptide repeat protein [Myxococcota bacterium]